MPKLSMNAPKNHQKWLRRAVALTELPLAKGGSPHSTVKVGAVLVDRDGHMIAASVNRMARGVRCDDPSRLQNGRRSLWINCAEQLALMSALKKRADTRGASLYTTLHPCSICAGMIAELGLKHVVFADDAKTRYPLLKLKYRESITIARVKLAEAGVKTVPLIPEA